VIAFLQGGGFLGGHGPLGSDLSLVIIAVVVVLLTIGWRLAAAKRFEAHRWVQTTAVVLSTLVAAIWMIRLFWSYVLPELPARLGDRLYGLTTLHSVVAAIAMVLGVVVVLRANELFPRAWRFSQRKYKPVMRTAYGLYLLAALLGLIVFAITYGL
jgi:uncharacterized membrane protein YozB (DUF420 family)